MFRLVQKSLSFPVLIFSSFLVLSRAPYSHKIESCKRWWCPTKEVMSCPSLGGSHRWDQLDREGLWWAVSGSTWRARPAGLRSVFQTRNSITPRTFTFFPEYLFWVHWLLISINFTSFDSKVFEVCLGIPGLVNAYLCFPGLKMW